MGKVIYYQDKLAAMITESQKQGDAARPRRENETEQAYWAEYWRKVRQWGTYTKWVYNDYDKGTPDIQPVCLEWIKHNTRVRLSAKQG